MKDMSRSYNKVFTTGLCCGDNRWFYKDRRHKFANNVKHQLRNLIANYDTDDVNDIIENPKYIKQDTWAEPTDGRLIYFSLDKLKERYKDWDKAKRKLYPKLTKKCNWK